MFFCASIVKYKRFFAYIAMLPGVIRGRNSPDAFPRRGWGEQGAEATVEGGIGIPLKKK